MSGAYEHAININVGGTGKRPVVSLWCMDCLVTVHEFDQINALADVQRAVDEHCSQMSKRERLTTPTTEALRAPESRQA